MAVINSYIAAASREHRNLNIERLRPIFQRRINNWTMPPPFPTHRMLSIDFFVGTAGGRAGIQTWRVSRHASAVSNPGGKRAMARPGALFVKGKALHDLYRQVISKKTSE